MSIDEVAAIERPTIEALQTAIELAKGPPHNMKSGEIKHTDRGAAMVRHYLPDQFHSWPLDEVRIASENLSKAGHEPGQRKRTDEQRQAGSLKQLVSLFPSTGEHSDEYRAIHASDEFKQLRDARKRALNFMCQGCCRHFMGHELEGHILDYEGWNRPGRMLILCRGECHPIFDALRRRGIKSEHDGIKPDMLF